MAKNDTKKIPKNQKMEISKIGEKRPLAVARGIFVPKTKDVDATVWPLQS